MPGHLLSDLLGQGDDNPENIILYQLRVGTGIDFCRWFKKRRLLYKAGSIIMVGVGIYFVIKGVRY